MSFANWTADDFADSFQRHMPTGAVWPRDPGTTQRMAVQALMPTYERSWSTAQQIPVEGLPSTTDSLLPEWESSLGLPDPCAGPDPTFELRRAHVVAKFTQSLGPSIPQLTAYAAGLGYTITIEEFAPARAGCLRAGNRLYGRDWAFTWRVHAPAVPTSFFRAGQGRAGDPLATFGATPLQCELQRIAPARGILLMAYGT